MTRPTHHAGLAVLLACVATLAACGDQTDSASPNNGASASASPGTVTVRNCGTDVTFPSPAKRLFVNDGNMISMVLAIGAQDNVAAVSSLQRDARVLREHYGSVVDALPVAATTYPGRETVLAKRPDVVVAGWNYGYDEAKGLTPASLTKQGIAPYILTESCRQTGGNARGLVDPWTALRTDLTNLGQITRHARQATDVVTDLDRRLQALRSAPKPDKLEFRDSWG